jgi:hypothetical protein
MQQFIKSIWLGEVCPLETCSKYNQEIIRLEGLRERTREKLINALGREEQEIFEKYIESVEELLFLYMEDSFECGVKYTAKFMLNALSENK